MSMPVSDLQRPKCLMVGDENVQIRLAVPAESAIIAEILREAFSEFKDRYTPEATAAVAPPADLIALRFAEGPNWLALYKGEIAGTVSVLPEPAWLYIRSMAVLPAAQGQGIGQRLLSVVEQYAMENGFSRLFLYTTPFSQDAIRLYEKNGFRLGRITSPDEWYGVEGLSMEKELKKGS